jgi:phosphohistidine phosphatase
MDVVLLRHGRAQTRSAAASADEERRRGLCEQGRRSVRRGARGLARLVPRLDAIATSALARAEQTAELVGERYAGLKPVRLAELEPHGSREQLAGWLGGQRPDGSVLLVGHTPELDQLAAWLLAGVSGPFLHLGKGGACLLSIEGSPGPASAELRWCLPARALRALA